MNFDAWLAAKGFDPGALSERQRASMLAVYESETRAATVPVAEPVREAKSTKADESPTDASFDEKMKAIEAENARVEYIREATVKAAEQHVGDTEKIKQIREIGQAAIADKKTSTRDFDLALLRSTRFSTPLVVVPQGQAIDEGVLEAAICKMGKLTSLESSFDDRTLSAADKHFRRGIGLHEMIGLCARSNGWRGSDVRRDLRTAMRAAFHGGSHSPYELHASGVGPSTLSVSGILSNTANKFLRDSWNAVENAWRPITAIRSVNDFKTITTYSLTGDLTYDKVAPGGEIKHGSLGNETYTNRADTYGKLIGIDRRDVINDDLGAFINVAKRLGRGGALKLNDVFWTEFMADASTFYTSGRGNYDDGTDTAFDAAGAGLKAAEVIWKAKTDPDGKPLGLMAKFLVVPPGHRITALNLMNSMNLIGSTVQGENNPWAGMFEVISSVYLANSSYTGYSALAWYMLADPNELPVIETAFLNGAEMPTVEDVEMSADHLGMAMRAYHDFGVNKQEYRAALKLKGEA